MGTLLNTTPASWGDSSANTPTGPDETIAKGEGTKEVFRDKSEDQSAVPLSWFLSEKSETGATDRRITFGEYSMSIDEVYRDIKRLTLSKNPLDLIFKANEIREKFAFFINSLATFISKSFSFEDESFSYELYHDSEYHRVWMELTYSFLRDARFVSGDFDTVIYNIKKDDGSDEQRTILLDDILAKIRKNQLADEDFWAVQALIQTVITAYRQTETISVQYAKRASASSPSGFTARRIENATIERFMEAMEKIDSLIENFPHGKASFRNDIDRVFAEYGIPQYDIDELRIYIFRKIIHAYYPDVCHVFFDTNLPYGEDKKLLKKEEWLRLKGSQELTLDTIGIGKWEASYREKNREYFRHVLNCKKLILDLESSLLSPILLPIILKLIASSLTLDTKEFNKFSYILLFLFANSYENEYIPLSRFLTELEVYINFSNARRGIERLKIGFSLIVLFILFIILGYFLLPPFVFIGGIIFVGIYLKMYFIDDYTLSASIQVNTGLRLWTVVILAVFGYAWISNIGNNTQYYRGLQDKITGFGSQIMAEIIPPEQIKEGVKRGAASILEWDGR